MSEEGPTYTIYDESLLFVDPSVVVDLRQGSCLTLSLSLKRLLEEAVSASKARTMLAMVNRARNKKIMMQYIK